MQWDVFCRVVDNFFGDIGVLAACGRPGRAWRTGALVGGRRLGPGMDGAGRSARRCAAVLGQKLSNEPSPGRVVIEAFSGCELPAAFVERMAKARPGL